MCAKCPMTSKEVGISDSSSRGKILERISSTVK